jgi:hypothetical protein
VRHLFFLSILLQSSIGFSLEINESLKFKLIQILDQNVIVISRGVEDDITEQDHVKIYYRKNLLARAVCIKSNMQTSYWKVYRTIKPNVFKQGVQYTLKDIQLSGIAPEYTSVDLNKYKKEINDFSESKWIREEKLRNIKNIELKIKHKIKSDEKIGEDFIGAHKNMEDSLNEKRFKNDMSIYNGRLYISPLQRQSLNQSEEINFGAEFGNVRQSKYDLRLNFDQQYSSQKDSFNGTVISNRVTSASAKFDIKRILVKTDYFSFIDYYQEKHTDITPIQQRIRFAPFGLRYWVHQSQQVPQFSIEYSPLLENKITEKFDYLRADPNSGVPPTVQNNDTNLRHKMGFNLVLNPVENLVISNMFTIAPLHELGTLKVDLSDLNLINTTSFQFFLNDSFSIDLSNTYEKDKARADDTGLPESNFIQTLSFNYFFVLQ